MSEELKESIGELLLAENIDGEITEIIPLTGGASAETYKFKVKQDWFVLRKGSGNTSPLAILKKDEAFIQNEVFNQGAPVAEIVAVSNGNSKLTDAYIMKLVEGESIARKVLRDEKFSQARKVLAYECGQALAKIHSVSLDSLTKVPKNDPYESLENLYLTYQQFKQPLPVFEYTFRWLKEQKFQEIEPTLVHGDFRLGNLIVNEEGLAAVIDWELVNIGNPIQDIGWMCVNSWRFGITEKIVGGFGDLGDLLQGYSSVSNLIIDEQEVKKWQIFGSLRWGVICLIQTYSHLNGPTNSVERAAIGRRVSETEIDMINLMFLGGK